MSESGKEKQPKRSPRIDPNYPGLEPLAVALESIRRPFFAAGTIPIVDSFKLFVHSKSTLSTVTLPTTSSDDLKPLLEACQQASFGRGAKDVLDPTYRRALVLQAVDFGLAPGSAIEPYSLGIIAAIQDAMFEGELNVQSLDTRGPTKRRIVATIDKLNVYRDGDFFKPHVDTPRSSNMFGTLLINFPVEHTGGQLVVHAPTWGERALPDNVVDSDREYRTSWGDNTSLGWVAFFSDCGHEVMPVTSGNRVTVTYNLFLENDDTKIDAQSALEGPHLGGFLTLGSQRLVSALSAPGIISPNRPRLCFHLEHRYAFDVGKRYAKAAVKMLKGRDASIYRALVASGLVVTFHFVIDPRDDEGTEFSSASDDSDAEPNPNSTQKRKWKELRRGKHTILLPSDARLDFGVEDEPVTSVLERVDAKTVKTLGIVEVGSGPDAQWDRIPNWDTIVITEVEGAPARAFRGQVEEGRVLDSRDSEDEAGAPAADDSDNESWSSHPFQRGVYWGSKNADRMRRNHSWRNNKIRFAYATYGNSSSLTTCYASICVVACLKGHELPESWRNL